MTTDSYEEMMEGSITPRENIPHASQSKIYGDLVKTGFMMPNDHPTVDLHKNLAYSYPEGRAWPKRVNY
jgi:hypothetical protein